MMKKNKKRNIIALALTAFLCIVLFSCARERGRTDINLEMTDEDSVEAIIDQDLLTAGGTVVNLEEPEQAASADTVTEVEEVEMQNPVVVSADDSLKPAEDTDSGDQPAMGLIDVEDTQVDSSGKAQEENLSANGSEGEALSTEELIAENKALINAEEKAAEVVDVEKIEVNENVPAGDNTSSTTTTASTAEEEEEEVVVDENVLPGDNTTTAVEEVSVEEMAFPDEMKKNIGKIAEAGKSGKPVPMPTAVRPPSGGYYTEYTTMDKTPKTAKTHLALKTKKTVPPFLTHTVKRGDTLWVISRKYGCTISELVAANKISRRSILKIGQVLKIPVDKNKITQPVVQDTAALTVEESAGTSPVVAEVTETVEEEEVVAPQSATDIYTVKSGDSYWKIARKYGITSTELMSLNNTSSALIKVGQKILVPRR